MKQDELAPAHNWMELGWTVSDAKWPYFLMTILCSPVKQGKTRPQVTAYSLPHVLQVLHWYKKKPPTFAYKRILEVGFIIIQNIWHMPFNIVNDHITTSRLN